MSLHHDSNHDYHYIRKVKNIPMLTSDEEIALARAWRETHDRVAVEKLINAHLRLVAKIAAGYRGYGLPLSDLIAEGNVGMMQAMKHYDPEKGFRLSTYAMWWIKASIQEHILHSWSLVKIGTTAAQRKLFFNLRKTRETIRGVHEEDHLTPELITALATKLKVREEEIVHMSQRLIRDNSLNSTLGGSDDNQSEWIEWLTDERDNQEIQLIQKDELKKRKALFNKAMECLNERERKIIRERRLKEPPLTLEEVSLNVGVSRERVRQIENMAFTKLQKNIRRLVSPHPHHV